MTYRLNDQQFHAVRKLPAERRYEHLIKRAADQRQLWSLRTDTGWVLGADDAGREFVPVWPHPRYAEASASGGWSNSTPAPIDVDEWLDEWTSGLLASGRLVGIFPATGDSEAAIDATAFAADLRAELALLE